MCKPETINWAINIIERLPIQGKRVLDVGAYNVNGSLREAFMARGAASYVGVDYRQGPGVDVVCRAEALVARFGVEQFDIVVSTSTFEHVRNWQDALANLKAMCRKGGYVLFTAASDCPYHAYPNDFWRFTVDDVRAIFADYDIESVDLDQPPFVLVRLLARKRYAEDAIDLHHIALESIMLGRRAPCVRWWHFVHWRFIRTIWRDVVIPLLRRLRMIVIMGWRIRILPIFQNRT